MNKGNSYRPLTPKVVDIPYDSVPYAETLPEDWSETYPCVNCPPDYPMDRRNESLYCPPLPPEPAGALLFFTGLYVGSTNTVSGTADQLVLANSDLSLQPFGVYSNSTPIGETVISQNGSTVVVLSTTEIHAATLSGSSVTETYFGDFLGADPSLASILDQAVISADGSVFGFKDSYNLSSIFIRRSSDGTLLLEVNESDFGSAVSWTSSFDNDFDINSDGSRCVIVNNPYQFILGDNYDDIIKVYDVSLGTVLLDDSDFSFGSVSGIGRISGRFYGVKFSPDDSQILVISTYLEDNFTDEVLSSGPKLFSAVDGSDIASLPLPPEYVSSGPTWRPVVAWSQDGKYVASNNCDYTRLVVWDMENPGYAIVFNDGDMGRINDIEFSRSDDGKLFVSYANNTIIGDADNDYGVVVIDTSDWTKEVVKLGEGFFYSNTTGNNLKLSSIDPLTAANFAGETGVIWG